MKARDSLPGFFVFMSMTVVSEPNVAVAPRLDHLRALEAESIHILREVVAEFERPVMIEAWRHAWGYASLLPV